MLDGIRWVLFDAVGTLIYPDPTVAEVYLAAARRFGSRRTIGGIRQRFFAALSTSQAKGGPTCEANERERWRKIVAQVIDDVPENEKDLFEELWSHFAAPEHWRLYDDVPPALSNLRQAGFELGIASNFDARLNGIVTGHQALAVCEAVFVSSEVGYTKPDARFFQEVERRLQVRAAQIALVGDDEMADVQGALAAGWRAIRLDRYGEVTRSEAICTLAELSC
jgi:putative hydrolase of the HAD superfamily